MLTLVVLWPASDAFILRDRQRYATTIMQGLVKPLTLFWSSTSPAFDDAKNSAVPFDLDKARSLLNEAGVAVLADIHFGRRVPGDGQHIRFSYAASPEAIKGGVSRLAAFVQHGYRKR